MIKQEVPELFILEKRQLKEKLIKVYTFISGKDSEEGMTIYCGFQWQY